MLGARGLGQAKVEVEVVFEVAPAVTNLLPEAATSRIHVPSLLNAWDRDGVFSLPISIAVHRVALLW